MNEISSFFSLPQNLPFPEDLPLLWKYAHQKKSDSPQEVLEMLQLVLLQNVGQYPEFLQQKMLFPPEFFPIAFHRTPPLIWGYLIDDPAQKFPVYIASYSPETGVGEALSTHHILSALLDWVNDRIEDIEEGMTPSNTIDALYQSAETLLQLYAQVPKMHKGMFTRNSWSIAQPADGFGLVVPFSSVGVSSKEEFLEKYPFSSEIEETKNALQEALQKKLPGLALFYGRNLWLQVRKIPKELETASKLLQHIYHALDRPLLAERISAQFFWLTHSEKENRLPNF